MNFLPESEVINLKYQLAQQIKASINRAASSKSSNTPFLDSCVDTLIDEMAELKIEISKLSLTLSGLKNEEGVSDQHNEQTLLNQSASSSVVEDELCSFPLKLDPEYLQNITNFHYPETSQNGRSYIWMGSGNKASIEFPMTRISPIKLSLKNVRFITDDIRQSLQLFVNGEELKYESLKQDEGYTITAFWMPLHNSTKDKYVIDIVVESSISVQELYPETNDTRKLCLALSEIEIQNNVEEYVNA
ncbi:MAG: hypothetical protein AAGF83_00120 [Cyanobacteria bacterium P01_G01_bin.67]